MKDELGDRMKLLEGTESDRRLMPLLPAMARVDGRCFHKFTADMKRPFDASFTALMICTAKRLAEETNAIVAYTQSDEISLAWYSESYKSSYWFDGRIAKMTSQLGALATLYFYEDIPAFFQLQERYEILRHRRPTFDARVWNVPNLMEAANTFVWREQDATRNSIQMAAGALFSHKELFEKDTKDMQEMMWQKGVNWNNYPDEFKRGTYILRKTVKRPFSVDEIEKLPPMHEARKNPDLVIERSEYQITRFPVPITKIEDRVGVLFKGLSV